ncbi:hypothetical protein GGI15_001080 [Coemansia interrupta]|uniref:Uncharacterized protein n=1 Tax=Coemansia interrupta TaxID=1126814 RepID=A0A9W8LNX9_9FUNG|nr:hypothetical protein GGI15_001080 [Coemansia interrupta]
MSQVFYETHHNNLSIGRSQAGSTTGRSLREQRKGALAVDLSFEQHQNQQQQQPYKEQADERRQIRHSRSFSNMEYTPQKARADGYTINSVSTPEAQRQMVAPHSDSKYASNTVSYRASERRQRAQRRKTDGSDEIREINRRPSTSHGSDTQRKVTYSQYPDFETIKDPFAKRDKIPRKHREPLHLDKGDDEDNGAEALEGGHARKDSQEGVPTPLKKRDKIPRHAVQQAPPPPPPLPFAQASEVRPVESLQMEPMDAIFPESPVTPGAQMLVPVAKPGTDRSARLESLISPVSLASPGVEARPTQTARLPAPVRTVSMRPVDTHGAAVMSPLSPLSGHTNSPRMDIDMDKVETLYARQSLIFERTKQSQQQGVAGRQNMRDSKMFSSSSLASVDKVAQAEGPRGISANGSGCAGDEDDGDDDDQHIPFDQVLIPTAFKRLRQALDDPSFEIDEETYRRFKLSERWYVREERMQMELAFNMGTFGESRKRTRVVQKRASQDSAETPYAEEAPAAAKANSNVLPTLAEHDDAEQEGNLEEEAGDHHDKKAYSADQPALPQSHGAVRVPEAAAAAAAYRPSLVAAAASVSALSTSQYYASYEGEQRGYVPPRQPEHIALEPMHVRNAAPQRSHSRKHRDAERRPPPAKKGMCGMCVVM